MAVTGNSEAENPYGDRGYTAEEWQRIRVFFVFVLLAGGLLLVVFASPIGIILVKNCSSPTTCSWDNAAADSAAMTCRSIGMMVFVAGLVERVLMVLTKTKDEQQ